MLLTTPETLWNGREPDLRKSHRHLDRNPFDSLRKFRYFAGRKTQVSGLGLTG
jgi:hypothetical protein